MPDALADLRVLDLSRVLAGPLATMVLGDLGADVIKVERLPDGDDTRVWGPPWDERGAATYFQSVNRNKRTVALDLADAEDRTRALRLAASADVLVENFRSGTTERFGLSYETLRRENPGLVYCSITGFGSKQGAGLPGYDLLVQAVGGLMSVTGSPEQPQKVGVALVDVICGLFATAGILAALRHRERTGEGQLVEIDLLSGLLAALVNQASAYTIAGVVGERLGNAHPSVAPYELVHTGEGDLALAVGTDAQFAALCETLGCPELARDPAFATNSARVSNRARLRELLEARLAERGATQWSGALAAAGVPAGPVNDIQAAFALATRLGLDPVVEIQRADGTTTRLPRNPLRFSATPPVYREAPPELPRRELDVGWKHPRS